MSADTVSTHAQLLAALARIEFRPDFYFTGGMDALTNSGFVSVRHRTQDSRGVRSGDIEIQGGITVMSFPVPARIIAECALSQTLQLVEHEACEWFRFDGQLLRDPHAPPK